MASTVNSEATSKPGEEAEEGTMCAASSLSEFDDVDLPAVQPSEILTLRTSEEFSQTFKLLYALKAKNELSERGLRLTSAGIKLNAGNPTVWMYRRRIVQELSASDATLWDRELGFTARVLQDSRKNYQAWEHRRFCVEQSGRFETEPDFVDVALYEDAKNYHAWAHRAWLVRNGRTDGEVATTEWMIRSDVRNNSAWNHRWVVGGKVGREGEVDFACEMSGLAPRNESVWNYLLALRRAGEDVSKAQKLAVEYVGKDPGCNAARRFIALCVKLGDKNCVLDGGNADHCAALSAADPVRSAYWAALERSPSCNANSGGTA